MRFELIPKGKSGNSFDLIMLWRLGADPVKIQELHFGAAPIESDEGA